MFPSEHPGWFGLSSDRSASLSVKAPAFVFAFVVSARDGIGTSSNRRSVRLFKIWATSPRLMTIQLSVSLRITIRFRTTPLVANDLFGYFCQSGPGDLESLFSIRINPALPGSHLLPLPVNPPSSHAPNRIS